jgi:hypothetical protein
MQRTVRENKDMLQERLVRQQNEVMLSVRLKRSALCMVFTSKHFYKGDAIGV